MREYTEDLLEEMRETEDLEFKLAVGEDGQGKLPKDFWPTYSAFANTQGGIIVLGVKQEAKGFRVEGIPHPDRVITELFDLVGNPEKVSCNLLSESAVSIEEYQEKKIILVRIPPATRRQKPVFIKGNPLKGNTYRRLFDGDHKCDDATVQRMLAEKQEEGRDRRILAGFGQDDIDGPSFLAFRQMLRDVKPGHTWLDLNDWDLLGKLQGWRKDRESGEQGLTIAGLAMFGRWESIQEGLPGYWVDYQERPEAKTEDRWVDRIYPDGTWPANLFSFYRRVYPRLVADLKVPFRIKDGQRIDFTPVHEAVREALVNCIVHADLEGRGSILVVKRPDLLGFRNPGGMRVPLEQAIEGGFSDCRNGIMHQMFLMVGLVERAGSGVPRIYSGWTSGHWRPPVLYEKAELDQTLLELRMLDLFPEEVISALRRRFPSSYDGLEVVEKLILATAAVESVVTHARISKIAKEHPHDVTLAFRRLVRNGLLESNGKGKGTVYHLPGTFLPSPDDVFGSPLRMEGPNVPSSELYVPSSEPNVLSSEPNVLSSELIDMGFEAHTSGMDAQQQTALHPPINAQQSAKGLAARTLFPELASEDIRNENEHRDECGRILSSHLKFPLVDDVSKLTLAYRLDLEWAATSPRSSRRLSQSEMDHVILTLCKDQYLTRHALSQLLNRNPNPLGTRFLSRLVRERKLLLAFPQTPTHERQAYIKVPDSTGPTSVTCPPTPSEP